MKTQSKSCVTSVKTNKKFLEKDISIILYYHNFIKQKSLNINPLCYITKTEKLIDYQLNIISKSFENYEAIVSSSQDLQMLTDYIYKNRKHNIRIVENQISEITNECESIRLALNNVTKEKVLIINGGVSFKYSNLKSITYDKMSTVMQDVFDTGIDIGVNSCGGVVQHFSFGANNAWPEVMFINNKENLNSIRGRLFDLDYRKKMFFELLNDVSLEQNIYVQRSKPMKKVINKGK